MIDSLRGELVERSPDHAVVECGGVGYLVYITADTYSRLPGKGACRLHVHYAVSVDVRSGQSEHKLYGFLDAEDPRLTALPWARRTILGAYATPVLGDQP